MLTQLREECHSGLEQYEQLSQLAATNVLLLYYVLIRHIEELAPVVYTPTVGEACMKFDRIYRCLFAVLCCLVRWQVLCLGHHATLLAVTFIHRVNWALMMLLACA